MKVYNVTEVLRQVINIKTMCPYYTLEFRNMTSYLLQVSRCVGLDITVIKNHVC